MPTSNFIPYTDSTSGFVDPEDSGDFFLYYVEYISINCIKVWFSNQVVVDSKYYDTSNYTITSSLGALPVVEVVETNEVVLPYALLYVRNQIEGQTYTVSVTNVMDREGTVIPTPTSLSWTFQRTKIDAILANMPAMYDKRPNHLLFKVLAAMAYSDNLIGGSVSDIPEST